MTTQRAVVFLLVVGGLVLFAVQNASPWEALVLFGARTQPLPLSVWMVGAIAAGVLTTLLMAGLLNLDSPESRSKSPRKGRSRAASSSRETQYRKTTPESESSWGRSSDTPRGSAGSASTSSSDSADPLDAQDWGTFKPPEQWDDWGQRPDPSVAVDTPDPAGSTRNKSKRKSRRQKEQYAVEESYEEIAGGWDDYEESEPTDKESAYVPRGGSPVDDALDDISDGWDDYEELEDNPAPPPPKDYEVKQAPKTVYRSGSLYSYSYDKPETSEADRDEDAYSSDEIEDEIDEMDEINDEDYPTEPDKPTDNRKPPGPDQGRVGPDGVYDADYRVIIPPSRNLEDEDDWEER